MTTDHFTVHHDGVTIPVSRGGAGRTLVLCPGLTATRAELRELILLSADAAEFAAAVAEIDARLGRRFGSGSGTANGSPDSRQGRTSHCRRRWWNFSTDSVRSGSTSA